MKNYWWLSYADDKGLNGVVIVEGETFPEAVENANRMKLRPEKGGQVVGISIIAESFDPEDLNKSYHTEEEFLKLKSKYC